MSNKGRPPTDEDRSLWNRFVSGITPLMSRDKTMVAETMQEKQSLSKKVSHTVPKQNKNAPSKKANVTTAKSQNNHHQLDGKTYERLRKGKIPIEAVLDMHGMTQDQAHNALIHCITNAYNHHRRCVLVITGKGKRSSVEGGVLKSRLPQWLSISPLDNMVLTHVQAKHRDGGEGAFYLYLKRHKGH